MKKYTLFSGSTPSPSTLYYVMDPMCSWCWAFQPVVEWLVAHPQRRVSIEVVLGGLAPDSDQPMPTAMRSQLAAIWRQIEAKTGTAFNHQFWSSNLPRRSTYPACRAVIAANRVKEGAFAAMSLAIQRAYYTEARNPSERQVLIALAIESGLDCESFITALDSADCQRQLLRHLELKDQLFVQGFPCLVWWQDSEAIPVAVGYTEQQVLEDRLQRLGLLA